MAPTQRLRGYATATAVCLNQWNSVVHINFPLHGFVHFSPLCQVSDCVDHFFFFSLSRIHTRQIRFPGERYAAVADKKAGGSGGFTLLQFLDANLDHTEGNIYVVGRPNFPEPAMEAEYDFVPVGLAKRVVRRRAPLSTDLWACHSSTAWATVAAEFRATATAGAAGGAIDGSGGVVSGWPLAMFGRGRARGAGARAAKANGDIDGSLSLPPSDKYGPEWWESTLRIILYDALSDSAAFGLERALAVPDEERGVAEVRLMTTAALYLEAVLRGYGGRCVDRDHCLLCVTRHA